LHIVRLSSVQGLLRQLRSIIDLK